MNQKNLYNDLLRCYHRSRKKLQRLVITGKNSRKQGILQRRIMRLFNMLTELTPAFKMGMAGTFTAGLLLFQPHAAAAQAITFNGSVPVPSGIVDVGAYSSLAFADLDGDGDMDVIAGESNGDFFYFENTGTATVPTYAAAVTNPFGLTNIGYYSFPSLADLDNDGDLDLISGSGNGNFFYFENTGTATAPAFGPVQTNPFNLSNIGYIPAPAFADLDHDGDFDLLVGEYYGNFYYFQNIGSATVPNFVTPQLNPYGISAIDSSAAANFADLDGDGDLDIMAGDKSGNFLYMENTGTVSAPAFGPVQSNPFGLTNIGNYSNVALTDLDGDGDLDLLAGEASGAFFYFENTTATGINEDNIVSDIILFPNPAFESASLDFTLRKTMPVSIHLFDMSGRNMITIQSDQMQQGRHSIPVNTLHLSKGIYLVRLRCGNSWEKNVKLIKM